MLREGVGPRREEVRGGWKNSIARSVMICVLLGRALALGGAADEQCVRDFGGKFQGKSHTSRYGDSWQDNIKMHLKETGWEGVE